MRRAAAVPQIHPEVIFPEKMHIRPFHLDIRTGHLRQSFLFPQPETTFPPGRLLLAKPTSDLIAPGGTVYDDCAGSEVLDMDGDISVDTRHGFRPFIIEKWELSTSPDGEVSGFLTGFFTKAFTDTKNPQAFINGMPPLTKEMFVPLAPMEPVGKVPDPLSAPIFLPSKVRLDTATWIVAVRERIPITERTIFRAFPPVATITTRELARLSRYADRFEGLKFEPGAVRGGKPYNGPNGRRREHESGDVGGGMSSRGRGGRGGYRGYARGGSMERVSGEGHAERGGRGGIRGGGGGHSNGRGGRGSGRGNRHHSQEWESASQQHDKLIKDARRILTALEYETTRRYPDEDPVFIARRLEEDRGVEARKDATINQWLDNVSPGGYREIEEEGED